MDKINKALELEWPKEKEWMKEETHYYRPNRPQDKKAVLWTISWQKSYQLRWHE